MLLVEDDQKIGAVVEKGLRQEGHGRGSTFVLGLPLGRPALREVAAPA